LIHGRCPRAREPADSPSASLVRTPRHSGMAVFRVSPAGCHTLPLVDSLILDWPQEQFSPHASVNRLRDPKGFGDSGRDRRVLIRSLPAPSYPYFRRGSARKSDAPHLGVDRFAARGGPRVKAACSRIIGRQPRLDHPCGLAELSMFVFTSLANLNNHP